MSVFTSLLSSFVWDLIMANRISVPFIFTVCLLFFGWVGFRMYNYFTYATPPAFSLKGIEPNGTYARTATGVVYAENGYKIYTITIKIDGQTIATEYVKAKKFEQPFTIDTTTLSEGNHTLSIEAKDSSYNANTTEKECTIVVDNTPLRAMFSQPEYTVDQGKTLHLKIQSNKKLTQATVKMFGSTYEFYPDAEDSTTYECFIPVECEASATDYMLNADIEDLVQNKTKLNCKAQVKAFEFKKQRGFTVSEEKLSQEKEVSMSAKLLNEALEKWTQESPKKKLWTGHFEYPVDVQRISTPFGEIRMTPERGRHFHKGIDLISRPKCVVCAAQHGKVIIKDRFFLTGNTIVIDHGLGVLTLYGHLDDYAEIEVGDMIKKGSPVGKLGMTGYATGYHLHFELRVKNTPVDPTEWFSTQY
jgi:murein DD-endopeptidase MepM/ murein hydrolase activator NlpD